MSVSKVYQIREVELFVERDAGDGAYVPLGELM